MADAVARKHGPHGLEADEELCLNQCLELFGSTWFTVSMLCLQTQRESRDCIDKLEHMHKCGCVRKPVNDGGQEYYEVMPSIVNPKKGVGG